MTNNKGAVFVGDANSVFVSRTRDTLCASGIDVVIIDPSPEERKLTPNGIPAKIWKMFRRFQRVRQTIKAQSPDKTAILHYLSIDSFWLIPLLSSHFKRVVAVAYGSDVLRRVKSRDWLLRIGLKKLNGVAATNNNVMEALITDFPFIAHKEQRIIRFGLPVFDALDSLAEASIDSARRKLGFDPDQCLVCLGYSASPGQRQLELIEFFTARAGDFSNIQFIVPVQYGSLDTRKEVQAACSAANTRLGRKQFQALTEFYDTENSALFRKCTDVLINHSISDAFSGTVQEVVYAGNLVLAASHLPYHSMPGFGSAIKTYDTLETASKLLTRSSLSEWRLQSSNVEKENRKLLHETSSWEAALPDWHTFIEGMEK